MHTHQPQVLALAMIEDGKLEPASQNALRFSRRVAYDRDYGGVALAESEGERVARAMDGKDILFMGNHGVMVGGGDVAKTYDDLYYLERAAMVQILAMSTGRPLQLIPPEMEEEAVRQLSRDNRHRYATEHFAAIKRILDRTEPEYQRLSGRPGYAPPERLIPARAARHITPAGGGGPRAARVRSLRRRGTPRHRRRCGPRSGCPWAPRWSRSRSARLQPGIPAPD